MASELSLTPRERTFLDSLVSGVENDARIRALFLGGSHATGNADEHSDLDLYLITTDEAFDGVVTERWELLDDHGELVFAEEHDRFGFRLLLFIYANGVRGEIALAPEADMFTIHSGPFQPLYDAANILPDSAFEYATPEPQEIREHIAQLLRWFWYDRWLLDIALARETLWTAHFYLERCRLACVKLARIQARPGRWPGGMEKAEGELDARWSERISQTVVPLESEAMQLAAIETTACYLDLGKEVADEFDVPFPQDLVETVSKRLTMDDLG